MQTVLTIDGREYLLPMDKAVQVLKLLAGALSVQTDYLREIDSQQKCYVIQSKPPSVQLTTLEKSAKFRDEEGNQVTTPAMRQSIKRIGNGHLKLKG